MNREKRLELKGFALFWIVVFAIVPLMYLIQYVVGRDSGISLTVILLNWLEILPYFLLFCIHNFLLAPLFFRKKYGLYFAATIAVFAAFSVYILATIIGPPVGADGSVDAPPGTQRPFSPESMKIAIGALIILVNLGIKALVRSAENERNVQQLRAESLHQRLEVLRYQINPHFFMNTLNNIQALVLTEPEKATECISEFSKLMRMVLSEGSSALVPLERELDYISHFVSLMTLQLPDGVEVQYDRPAVTGAAMVPALAMVSFVENAFKHGNKAGSGAFIRISVSVNDGRVVFRCSNKLQRMAIPEESAEGGVGISNVRKRLELLYQEDYTLEYGENGEVFDVSMSIPAHPKENLL
jgi:LytS/YehU family sensor histidine kinase